MLTAALAGGGFGYLLLSPALAWLAYVSLPLMLIWVAGMGLWLSRGRQSVSQACQRPANRDPVIVACRSFRRSRAQSRIPGRSGH